MNRTAQPYWDLDGDHFWLLVKDDTALSFELHVYRYDGVPVINISTPLTEYPGHASFAVRLTEDDCRLLSEVLIQVADGHALAGGAA